ncbi:type I restriction enzyme HsdR N-terminal domain-containing protein [Rhodonellum sp.]|uniref:type I restriction enzyme HsdR N-terminal domain-containing protein n=1 Tax=Rhodonellum sp. TaxID=2231180 RepID=UPI0027292909|nr:type I restriction enzyme HsdR N-terminal domain-containing protein [Rhodonellum sp.]MDO9551829.1 type I restriction enzyme HsdR N-terminal domain-containing protein [Rhodonellum sp.]
MVSGKYGFLNEKLQFPPFHFNLREEGDGKLSIFDALRKKYLIVTPEEWVRQHIILYLTQHHQYPKSLFALEKGIKYNSLNKRFDILVLDREGAPFLLIECKAPEVALTQKTVEQVCVYNKSVGARHIGISNGKVHLFFTYDLLSDRYIQTESLPKL